MRKLYNNKILVIGAFGFLKNQLDGQTVKTRSVYNLLVDRYEGKVEKIDTQDVKRAPWLFIPMLYHLITCKILFILPCRNNLTYFFPFVYVLSVVYRFDIVCICIGGRQVEYFNGQGLFKPHKLQLHLCKKIKAFLPQMESVNSALIEHFKFNNTAVFPNFRKFKDISVEPHSGDELKIVFMARIRKDKGYPAVFSLAEFIRKERINATITFYGSIDPQDKDVFQSLIRLNNDIVFYRGVLNPECIQETLSQYDVMVLPTSYYTEGFPGTVLDAFIAGIPVIVTEWEYSHEFVDEGKTGFIVPFENGQDQMNEKVKLLYTNRVLLNEMKINAKAEREKYSEDSAWRVIEKYICKKTN